MDDAPEMVDVTVDLTRKDSNNEEDVYYNAVDELKVTEGNDCHLGFIILDELEIIFLTIFILCNLGIIAFRYF
jgi:hypothetical protein